MNQKRKNTILAVGIATGLLSLPMTWMTLHNPTVTIDGGFGQAVNTALQGMTFHVSGLNGHVTLLFKIPLWFVVGIAVIAGGVQLMRSSQMFEVPRAAQWAVAVVAGVFVTIPMFVALGSGKATPGFGWLLGLCSAAAPLVCLAIPDSGSVTSSAPDDTASVNPTA